MLLDPETNKLRLASVLKLKMAIKCGLLRSLAPQSINNRKEDNFFLENRLKNVIAKKSPCIARKFNYKSTMQAPKIEKIVLNKLLVMQLRMLSYWMKR